MATSLGTITTSKQWRLNAMDWLHGLYVAVAAAVASPLLALVDAGSLAFDWKHIGQAALIAGSAYILRSLVKPSQTIVTGAEFHPPVVDGSTVTITAKTP